MIKKGLFLVLAGLASGILMGVILLVSGKAARFGPTIGAQVMDFSLPGLETGEIKLSQFRGKAVLLNFWATWCSPCKEEMPLLQKIDDEKSSSLVVIGINSQEQASIIKPFIEENHIRFPIALDLSGEVTRNFRINGYPTTFFIDSNGILRDIHVGQLQEDLLQKYLLVVGVTP